MGDLAPVERDDVLGRLRPFARWVGSPLLALVWTAWVAWMVISIRVVADPTGFGGVVEPDGLEYLGLMLGVMTLPLLAAVTWIITRWARGRQVLMPLLRAGANSLRANADQRRQARHRS